MGCFSFWLAHKENSLFEEIKCTLSVPLFEEIKCSLSVSLFVEIKGTLSVPLFVEIKGSYIQGTLSPSIWRD